MASRDEARARLLRAALELAENTPFRDLTVDEIARAAELSRSAFYVHFRDKTELLVAAVDGVSDELARLAERWWTGEGGPAAQVRAAVSGLVAAYAEHAALLRIANEAAAYDEEVRGQWTRIMGRFIDATSAHLSSEQGRNTVDERLDPVACAEALVWMAERCCGVYISGGSSAPRPGPPGRGERTPEEVVEQLASVWTLALYPGVTPAERLSPDAEPGEGEPLWGVPAPEFKVTDTRSRSDH